VGGTVGSLTPQAGLLRAKLRAAVRAHDRGNHIAEWNELSAFINQIAAQVFRGIDFFPGVRFTGYALDLIGSFGSRLDLTRLLASLAHSI